MAKQLLRSPQLGDQFPTTRAIKSDNLIFLMGHVSVDDQRKEVVGKGDITAQTRRVFDRMKIALEDAEATLDDLVQITIYATDRSQLPQIRQVREEYFKGDWPASTTVIVKALGNPDCLVEIEGIAITKEARASRKIIRVPSLGDTFPTSRAIVVDGLVFLMGMVAVDETRKNVVGKGDVAAQAWRVFDRMRITLAEVGATLDDMVHMTLHITDRGHMEQIRKVREEYFKGVWPASASIIMKALGNPDFLLEVQGIAALPSKSSGAKRAIRPPRLAYTMPTSPGIKVSSLVFLKGLVPVDYHRNEVVGKGDMKAQAQWVFEAMNTVLQDAGASLNDLVQYTAFITDIGKIDEFHQARDESLKGDRPPGTLVEVNGLSRPDIMVEIRSIAAIS